MLRENEIQRVLTALLEDSGTAWRTQGGLIRFRLRRDGMTWETACRCLEGRLLAYGRCPFVIGDIPGFLAQCSRINSQVVQGALFLPEDSCPVFRTGARLYGLYDARERIAHALEYNAAVIARFWGQMARYQ